LAQYDINLREYWRILRKRKIIVILTSMLLGIFSTTFAILQAPTPLYTSVCSIKFEKETALEGLYARTLSWSGGDDIETQMTIIKSYSILMEVAKDLGLIPNRIITEKMRLSPNIIAVVEKLQSKVQVSRESYTNILNIKVTDPDPVFTQRMANAIAVTYKKSHAEQQGKRTMAAIKYIDDQLWKMRQNLQRAEETFNSFSQKNQLISIDMQSENLLLRTKEIRGEIRKLDEDKSELETLLVRVNTFIKNPSDSEDNFYSTKADKQYQATNDALVGLLLNKDTLLENYTSRHPEVIAIGQKVIENARKMTMLLRLQIDNKEKRKIDLNRELDEVDRKTNTLMGKKLEFDRLKREVESSRNMTALLEQKNQEALIRKAEKPEEVVLVKPALLPTAPINPPKTATTGATGIIIGLVLGLVLAFIVETFDTSLGAIEDVEETLGAKVLGVIPYTDPKDIQENLKDRYPEGMDERTLSNVVNLVSHYAPKTMISESFRALRTNIQFREGDDKIKTIAVASTSPKEGKTLVSVNLAISMAQAGLKTLLVGADLRKPMLAKTFGLESIPGLTDIVLGSYPWADTVKSITDIIMGRLTMDEVMMTPGMDNLHIITSGIIPPNPAELIESRRLMDFIKEAGEKYDIVIFDSTPILSTADATILGTKVDGVLIVYRVGAVSKGLLKRSSTQLEQVQCNIIGIVLNGMKPDISPDFQDFKYYKYYSYYGEEGKEKEPVYKKALSFIRGKGEDAGSSEGGGLPASVGKAVQAEQEKKPGHLLRWFLIIVAVLFLTVGVLWQNGIIDPVQFLGLVETVKKDSIKPTVVKSPSKPAVKKGLKVVSIRPENTKITTPEKKPIPDTKAPVFQPDVKAEEKAVIKEAVSPYRAGSYPYSLYLGSFRSLERAEKAITKYSPKGLSPFWVKVHFKEKGVWYRIYMGHFKNQEDAQGFGMEHGVKDIEIKKTAYANLIDTYTSSDELDARVQSLKVLGYSPYIIGDQDDRFRLFIGAFLTKAGAEEQYNELKSDDVKSQVVRR